MPGAHNILSIEYFNVAYASKCIKYTMMHGKFAVKKQIRCAKATK